MNKQKKTVVQPTGYRIYSQYILIGAALGLYYGLTYRNPQHPPDWFTVVLLSVLAAIVSTVVRAWKKGKTSTAILLDFIKMLGMFLLYMGSLELRAVIEGIGGRAAVMGFMIMVGCIVGAIFAIQKKPYL